MAENGEIVAAMIDGKHSQDTFKAPPDRGQAAALVERAGQQP
jgi:SOS-response transcriptional repressor LexA